MKVLITGGAGYIGTELVSKLAENPEIHQIILYDNLSRGSYNAFFGKQVPNGNKIKFALAELLDMRTFKKHIQEVDIVYHLAAKVTTPYSDTDAHFYEQVNHWGTAELACAIKESNVKKLIYTSSVNVYGSHKNQVGETHSPNPRTFYGISKMRGEEHVQELLGKKDKKAFILRCGNIYGYSKNMRFDNVVNKFMFDANFSNRIQIHGNGRQVRAFISIESISNILNELATSCAPSGVYNVVEKNFQILDIVDQVKEIYPQLEFIFINQHLNLRTLEVKPESELWNYISHKNEKDFKQELLDFKEAFAF